MSNIQQYKTKVYYEDTDAGGIVYYANYLKFTERARTEMIYHQLKLNHRQIKKEYNVGFVVKFCDMKFHKPAQFEDEIVVLTKILKKTPVRLNLSQDIKKDEDLLVSSNVELAVINDKGLVQKLPEVLYKKI